MAVNKDFILGFGAGKAQGGGGSEPTGTISITSNGTHNVRAYASANVNVPNSYTAADEGKVVQNGALASQTSRSITENGTYDTTTNDEVTVNVPSGGGVQIATGTFTGNDSQFAKFACAFEPDAVCIKRINVTELSVRVFAGFIGGTFGTFTAYSMYQNNANATYFGPYDGSFVERRFSYSNGQVTIDTLSSRPCSSLCEYSYYAIKWTT